MHNHPCAVCNTPVECDGFLQRNYDGWPEVVCSHYHLENGSVATVLCETCKGDEEQ